MLALNSSAQTEPDDVEGLTMWLRSDTGVSTNEADKVIEWEDLSGNGNHAFQNTNNFRPALFQNMLDEYPSVWFDGANDWLNFPELTDIRTVFWLVKEHEDATIQGRCLLGHSAEFDFLRGPEYNVWHGTFSAPEVLDGTTRLNFSEIDGTTTTVPHDFSIISIVTTGNTSASRFSLDRELYSHIWDGELIELIVYNEPLTPEQVEEIEDYLANRYTSEFYVSDDVQIEYGFCDTTICAAPDFENYEWNTGATSQCISVNQSGVYSVSATDRFDRLHQGEVQVSFPGNLQFESFILCEDSIAVLDTELSEEDYSFFWQDESDGSSFSVSQAGVYQVEVQDSLDCSAVSLPATVEIDDLASTATIGGDAELCEGNEIVMVGAPFEIVSWLWNDEAGDSSYMVAQSEVLTIEAIDIHGCVFEQTITVDVLGAQPTVDFGVENLCHLDESILTDSSTSEDAIVDWHWTFESGEVIGESVTSLIFPEVGANQVNLKVTTGVGCSATLDTSITIHPRPVAAFIHSLACEGEEVTLWDNSIIESGEIVDYSWVIEGSSFDGFQTDYLFEGSGNMPLQHTVVSEMGCEASLDGVLFVNPAAILDFEMSGACLGQLSEFDPDVDENGGGSVLTYWWEFGDGTTSLDEFPIHFYPDPGVYEVLLAVVSNNGCEASFTEEIEIYDLPEIAMNFDLLCTHIPVSWFAEVVTNGGDVADLEWFLSDESIGNTSSGQSVFDSPGERLFRVEVETTNGCASEVDSLVTITTSPTPWFTYTPTIGPPPLTVYFEGSEEGTLHWEFGDGIVGGGSFPQHTYEETGAYTGFMTITDDNGCYSTEGFGILVGELLPDLVVEEVFFESGQLSAIVRNASNFNANEIQMAWWVGNSSAVFEYWYADLEAGESAVFTFASAPDATTADVNYLCVEAEERAAGMKDIQPGDNVKCIPLSSNSGIELFPPFPNPAQEVIDLVTLSEGNQIARIDILDMLGRVVFENGAVSLSEGFNRLQFAVGHLRTGSYIIRVEASDQIEIETFFVE